MRLYECEAKRFLAEYGIPTPKGVEANSTEEVVSVSEKIGGPVAIKAQLLVGGRGKSGAVLFAEKSSEVVKNYERIQRQFSCNRVLVEEYLRIKREGYLSIGVEPGENVPVVLASPYGGMDVETLTFEHPDKLCRVYLNPLVGMRQHHAYFIGKSLDFPAEQNRLIAGICLKLYKAFVGLEASLIEVNPLALVEDGRIFAIDAKIIIDDYGLFRHPELKQIEDKRGQEDNITNQMARRGIQYMELGGEVGLISIGAGITMELMDLLADQGSSAFCFSDSVNNLVADFPSIIRGELPINFAASMKFLLSYLLSKGKRKILVNITSGGTPVDGLTRGFLHALKELGKQEIHLVVHVGGNGEGAAKEYLSAAGINPARTLADAVRQIVREKR
jgi:succinyl-CoA synthetase beta subunit